MKEWFASWFDTPYYHTLYKNRDRKEAEAFIRKLFQTIQVEKGCNVLDLACGKGRHAVFIHSLGFNTVGVDLSADSIKSAKQDETDGLKFFVHDMRQPIEDQKFDTVVNLFTSFGYFDHVDENRKVLNAINQYLSNDGMFVIDFFNVDFVLKNLVPYDEKTIDNITFKISKRLENGFIIKDIQFEDKGQSFAFQEKVQALSLSDFKVLLNKENYEIKKVFGDYELNSLDENSDRLIIVAKKK